jgi:hypothetical protein
LHTDHGDLLEVGAVIASGLEAVAFELIGDVLGREVATLLVHAAAFECVTSEITDVSTDFFGIESGSVGGGAKQDEGRSQEDAKSQRFAHSVSGEKGATKNVARDEQAL